MLLLVSDYWGVAGRSANPRVLPERCYLHGKHTAQSSQTGITPSTPGTDPILQALFQCSLMPPMPPSPRNCNEQGMFPGRGETSLQTALFEQGVRLEGAEKEHLAAKGVVGVGF